MTHMRIELSDSDILARLSNLEDSFVERKTEGDSSDWLKTIVAFANSTPIGYPAVMFIGVKNDGTVQGLANPDSTQKSLSARVANCFPSPYILTKVLDSEGKKFLAVIVPGSELRPHFSGPAFIRDNSRTIAASDAQFSRLIAQRNSVAYEILQWLGKAVSIWYPNRTGGTYHPATGYNAEGTIADCNQFYVTISGSVFGNSISFSLDSLEIGFDHNLNRLQLRFKAAFG